MDNKRAARLLIISILTGCIGDMLLQTMTTHFGYDWGLKQYFKQHGRAESVFIAGGMLGLFYALYLMSGLPLTLQHIGAYGIILDLIFREARIFPSLDGYYKHFGYIQSGIWGAVPMMLVLLIDKAIF